MDDSGLLDIATEAARAAGLLLVEQSRRKPTGVGSKSTPTDLVSDADRAADALLQELISAHRPKDGFITEESAGRESATGLDWVLDPLDGTVNYLFRIPWWCVSVAVEDSDGPVAAAIYNPSVEEMFTATRGEGARLNGSPIRVGDADDLARALIGTGFSYDPQARRVQAGIVARVLPRARDIRRAGSAALDLTSLACGRLDGFYEAPMEHWDRAAGALIVSESGGLLEEMPAPREGLSSGLIAAGPALLPTLRALVLEG